MDIHTNNEIRGLSDSELLIYYKEYKRRWRLTHKDKVRLYNMEYYKKFLKKIKRTTETDNENPLNIPKNPLNVVRKGLL